MKYEKGSFIVLPNRHVLHTLTPGALAVYVHLCDFSDNSGSCFPSRSKLAERIGMSVDSVDRFLREIESAGLVSKAIRRRTDGSNTSSEYQLLLVGSRTHTAPPSRTHASAELNPVLTKPTVTAGAEKPEIVEVHDSSEESETKRPRLAPPKQKAYDELIAWSERERGFPFLKTARLKQYTAFRIAGENNIPHKALVERWEEMSGDKFWKEKGFDWMNVVTSFNLKPV